MVECFVLLILRRFISIYVKFIDEIIAMFLFNLLFAVKLET